MKEVHSIRLENAEKQQIEVIRLHYKKYHNLTLNTSQIIRTAITNLYNTILSNK